MPIEHAPNPHNEAYLRAKRDRMGHTLHHQGLALDEQMVHDEHVHDRERRRAVKFAIVVGRFYEDLAERLVAGAQGAFAEAGEGRPTCSTSRARSSCPLAAPYLAETGRYAGVACLGAVIRGETAHYDYVCAEAARGIMDVQLRTGVPVRVRRAHGREHGPGARPHRRRQARPGRARGRGRASRWPG